LKKRLGSRLVDRISLFVLSVFQGHLKKGLIEEQYRINKKAWKDYSDKFLGDGADGIYIEKQSEMKAFRYGTNKGRVGRKLFNGKEMTGADNTCEVIAVHNLMRSLGRGSDSVPDFPELLRHFSKKGIAFRGMFGTNPGAMKRFLTGMGYTVEKLSSPGKNSEKCDELEKDYDAFILTTFNEGQNPFSMVHTMCITKEEGENERKIFRIHNDYQGSRSYDSLYKAAVGYNDGKGHPIVIYAVRTGQRQDEKTGV